MPFRIGVVAYPLFLVALMASRTSAVSEFEKAGAFDEFTARRPESLNVRRRLVVKALEKKLLIAVGDGRYYVDRAAVKRRDRNFMLTWGGVGLVITVAVVLILEM